MHRCTYDLHGLVLRVEGPHQDDVAFLEAILGPLAIGHDASAHWTVTVGRVAEVAPPPTEAARVWEGCLPEGLSAAIYDESTRRIFRAPGHFLVALPQGQRCAEISVAPGGSKALRGTVCFWLVDRILAAFDRHLLHAACLVAREPAGAIALFAPSGTGKTTTALALARAGLGLAGDDALVLRNTDGGALIWGVPRRLRVHRKTAALMPWLAPALADWAADEQPVAREKLAGFVEIAGPTLNRARGIVVLRPPNSDGHRIERIGKAQAVSHIVADNVRRAPTGVERGAQAAFAAIAKFVATTPVVALSVGPDPGSLDLSVLLEALR